jgi:carbon monoxide dehydrogenase subunit G
MDMTGEYRIPAPRQAVWDALNDPEVLKASIPDRTGKGEVRR